MPWIKEDRFYLAVLLLLILIMAVRTPLDTDMWWHLRAGEETWLDKEIYSEDTFSFTRDGEPWLNHSWLSQLIMYLLYSAGSYKALTIWVGTCAVVSISLVYLQMDGHPIIRMMAGVLAGIVASVVWSPRPQIMSLVLFAAVGFLIYLYKWKKSNRLWWLPLIFILWSNLHGGYILGIILIGTMIGGEIFNKMQLEENSDHLSWREIGILSVWVLVCLLVVLINPFGFGMWKIPFNTVGVESLQNLISEWASPDFHQFYQQPMLWMLFGVLAALGLSKRRIDGSDLACLIIFGWGALTARRNFGPFALVAAPILTRHLNPVLTEWKTAIEVRFSSMQTWLSSVSESNEKIKPGFRHAVNFIVLLMLSGAAVWKIYEVSSPLFIKESEQAVFPVEAVEFFKGTNEIGQIFNEYNWGGYLIWNLRDFTVFVDGRTDLFGDEIIGEWIEISKAENNWQDKLDHWEIDYILIRPDRPLAAAAAETWETLIDHEEIILLGRKE